jgi:2'-5' RNA ligase
LIRAFIAVTLAPSVVEEIAKVQAALRRADGEPGAVRWTRVENMHLTLKFLGNIDQHQVAPILTRLRHVGRDCPAFQVEARQLGGFPSLKRPRVIWVGLHDTANDEALQGEKHSPLPGLSKAIETALSELDFPVEQRDFRPHITLGRVRSQRGWDRILPLVQDYRHTSFGTSVIDRISLYRSDLRPKASVITQETRRRSRVPLPTGAIYTALGSVPLRN